MIKIKSSYKVLFLATSGLIIFCACVLIQKASEKYFEVQQLVSKDGQREFKINFVNDSSDVNRTTYPIKHFGSSTIDTLAAIGELLNFEGDTSTCFGKIKNYGSGKYGRRYSSIDGPQKYSIQVEALYIINQLYFRDPFSYSPVPVLVDLKDKSNHTISGPIVHQAYQAYKKWFDKVKSYGLKKARSKSIKPLDSSNIIWW